MPGDRTSTRGLQSGADLGYSLLLHRFSSCASYSLRLFDDRLKLSVANRTFQRGMVLFVLIGICD